MAKTYELEIMDEETLLDGNEEIAEEIEELGLRCFAMFGGGAAPEVVILRVR